ncbi:MAG: AMP-binding protein, partial [Rubrivivax sp.]|nr:AMP-binding protein [Rubrivivax sp.]
MSLYLTQGLHRAIQRSPNQLATVCGPRRRTYAELGDRVARLAGALQKLGMKPEDRVGMLAMNSDRYLEYFLGVWWGGGAVNAANTRWSAAEIAYSLDDSGTRMLIVDDAFVPMADELRKQSKALQTLIYAGDKDTPAGMLSFEGLLADATPVPDAGRSGDDLAGVYYTGGTTGFPKGVMLTHTNLGTTGLSLLAHGLAPDGMVGLHAAPMFHLADGAMTLMITL